jgi:hypothetical protein
MPTKIKHISFFYNDERHIVIPNSSGYFIMKRSYVRKSSKAVLGPMSAHQLMRSPIVRNGDPVITLLSGEKIRIYQGGDPAGILTRPEAIMEAHDSFLEKRKNRIFKTKLPFPGEEFFKDFPEW